MKKIIATLSIVFILIYFSLQIPFRSWRNEMRDKTFKQSKLLNIGTKELEYRVIGEGPALLWFHGVGGGFDQIDAWKAYKLISVSRPGYLRTTVGLGQSYDEHVYIYKTLLDSLNIDEVIVLGFSAGGPTALSFAKLYPERTKALILISAITKELKLGKAIRESFDLSLDFLFGDDFSSYLDLNRFLANPSEVLREKNKFFSIDDQKRLLSDSNAMERIITYNSKLAATKSLRFPGFVNDRKYYAKIGENRLDINSKSLIIHGKKDADVDFSHAESAHKRIKDSKLIAFENAGHYLFLSRWDELRELISNFLEEESLK